MAKTGNKGIKRIVNAAIFSYKGMKSAFINEEAFRQEVFVLLVLTPVAFYISDNVSDAIFLICSILLVLIVELINSAIEATVDRIGDEHHELSGRAKDMGSAAVTLAILVCAGVWFAIILR